MVLCPSIKRQNRSGEGVIYNSCYNLSDNMMFHSIKWIKSTLCKLLWYKRNLVHNTESLKWQTHFIQLLMTITVNNVKNV